MPITRRPARRPRFAQVSIFALALAAGLSCAATAGADEDPPTRVGRIALIQGSVSFHPSPTDEWGAAVLNYPVAQSTAVFADAGARAELEIGEARVRLDAGAEVDIVQLDDNDVILSVPQGRVDVSLHGRQQDERYDIQTPRGDVDLLDDGTYRVIAGSPQDPTRIASFGGRAQLSGGSSQVGISGGQEMVATPTDPPSFTVVAATQDGFDQWSAERDQQIYSRPVPSYVPSVPGIATLSEYGTWRDVPDYGHVWVPSNVDPGWAPYRAGHWAWVAPWGYTWIDNEPWGFAPFHYGRWAQIQGGAWGWIPVEPGYYTGRERYRPAYAPAMVSFIGDVGGLGVSIGIGGGVGWVPLGPHEVWHPWYHTSDNYLRRVNIVNVRRTDVVNITRINEVHRTFVNQRYVTVVRHDTFAHGDRVDRAVVRIPPAALSRPITVIGSGGAPRTLPPPAQGERAAAGLHAVHAPPPPKLAVRHPAPGSAQAFRQHGSAPGATNAPARGSSGESPRPGVAAPGTKELRAPVRTQGEPVMHPGAAAGSGHPAGPPTPTVQHPPIAAPTNQHTPSMQPQHPAPAPQGQRPGPAMQQPRTPVMQPQHPVAAPQVPHPAPARPPQRPAPATQPQRPAPVTPPQRPAPAVQQHQAPVMERQRSAPVMQQHQAPVMQPQRPAPVPRRQAPVMQPQRQAPAVQQHVAPSQPHPQQSAPQQPKNKDKDKNQ